MEGCSMPSHFNDETYFCGRCRRQQDPSKGEKCVDCGRLTVSWYTDRETEQQAIEKWKQVNGG